MSSSGASFSDRGRPERRPTQGSDQTFSVFPDDADAPQEEGDRENSFPGGIVRDFPVNVPIAIEREVIPDTDNREQYLAEALQPCPRISVSVCMFRLMCEPDYSCNYNILSITSR
eukprot:746364-Hanusia_phi.AAC.6